MSAFDPTGFVQTEIRPDGVATLWLDRKGEKQNVLTMPMIEALELSMRGAMDNPAVRAVVIISRKKDFLAGADIASFKAEKPGDFRPMSARGHELLNQLAASHKPFVAAIHGTAFGLGTELPLACHARIASDDRSTKMALPEVKLGLLPGSGGTQRLPRLVGLRAALDMMLTGKNIFAKKARSMGLVDEIVPVEKLHEAACTLALKLVGTSRDKVFRPRKRSLVDKFLDGTGVGQGIVLRAARKTALRQSGGHYPAVPEILNCVEIGLKQGMAAGFEAEAEKFEALMLGPVSKELINIFFNMTEKKKNPLAGQDKPVRTLGVIGSGFMGAGIAEVSMRAAIGVIIKDMKDEALANAKRGLWKSLEKDLKRKSVTRNEAEEKVNSVRTTTGYELFRHAEVVVEAVFEEMGLKQRIVRETEPHLRPDAIFATNTSALSIGTIASAAQHPERVIGLHYFSPVPKMPLLEIVTHPLTADWVTATAISLGNKQGKTCIVVKDSPGFYANRILAPYLNEAMVLLDEGVGMEVIDRALKGWGFPVGPVALMDEVGIDVGAHVMSGDLMTFYLQRPGAVVNDALIRMNADGYKGRKGKLGFYDYSKKRKKPNAAAYTYFKGQGNGVLPTEVIQNRLALLMVNEAVRTLEEGIIASPRDGDIGAVFGIGFPPFRGGPFRYIDSVGAATVVAQLETLARQYGERFAPAALLKEMAREGKRFY